MAPLPSLPPGVQVFERGWLSANGVLFEGPEGSALVDSGYCTHSQQTLSLVELALQDRPLERLLNTHLHSDHCGGNAALQQRYPALTTHIPPGEAEAVLSWDESGLSYQRTGQSCPRFRIDGVLRPGTRETLAALDWQVLAAPGHDMHAVLLYQPEHRLLISGDALWENGFGVVFPELEGQSAFDEVGDTLDLIESLQPLTVIPGHGRVFGGHPEAVVSALARARSRLTQFRTAPHKHTVYAAKVLLKFKLMEWQRLPLEDFLSWACNTPYVRGLHQQADVHMGLEAWIHELLADLQRSGAALLRQGWLVDV